MEVKKEKKYPKLMLTWWVRQLKSNNFRTFQRAYNKLLSCNDNRMVDLLIDALKSKNKDYRSKVVKLLGDIGDNRAVEPLIVIAKRNNLISNYHNRYFWKIVLQTLLRFDDPKVFNLIFEIIKRDENSLWQKEHFMMVTGLLGYTEEQIQPNIKEVLNQALTDEDLGIRIMAAETLCRYKEQRGLRTIVEELEYCEYFETANKYLRLIENFLSSNARTTSKKDLIYIYNMKSLTKLHAHSGGAYGECTAYNLDIDTKKIRNIAYNELISRGFSNKSVYMSDKAKHKNNKYPEFDFLRNSISKHSSELIQRIDKAIETMHFWYRYGAEYYSPEYAKFQIKEHSGGLVKIGKYCREVVFKDNGDMLNIEERKVLSKSIEYKEKFTSFINKKTFFKRSYIEKLKINYIKKYNSNFDLNQKTILENYSNDEILSDLSGNLSLCFVLPEEMLQRVVSYKDIKISRRKIIEIHKYYKKICEFKHNDKYYDIFLDGLLLDVGRGEIDRRAIKIIFSLLFTQMLIHCLSFKVNNTKHLVDKLSNELVSFKILNIDPNTLDNLVPHYFFIPGRKIRPITEKF